MLVDPAVKFQLFFKNGTNEHLGHRGFNAQFLAYQTFQI